MNLSRLQDRARTMIGYPLNLRPLPVERLATALGFVLNNLGDPYVEGTYGLNTFAEERGVVQWFADLFHLPKNETWGYVTSCGSESNLRGLSLGCQRHADAAVYYSDKVHYSVTKAVRLMRRQGVSVDTDLDHEMDVSDFASKLDRSRPAVVCLTVGTTMAGAVDDVAAVAGVLKRAGVPFHLHVDAALSGLILPFLPGSPCFDFRLPIDSIAVSGHKMLGTPIPCGVLVARKDAVTGDRVDYLGSRDTTIGGSRSGFSVLLLQLALEHYGLDGLGSMARRCVEMAELLDNKLNSFGWPHWRHPSSNTVVLRKPPEKIVRKYQLAVEGDDAHAIMMPHVTDVLVSEFTGDLEAYRIGEPLKAIALSV